MGTHVDVSDALNMARHQASMTQQGKVVSVFEYPQHVHDQLPLRQMISELERANFLPTRKSHHSGKTRLPLLWRIDADVPDILMGDTMRLTQILLNLCSNAVKVCVLILVRAWPGDSHTLYSIVYEGRWNTCQDQALCPNPFSNGAQGRICKDIQATLRCKD